MVVVTLELGTAAAPLAAPRSWLHPLSQALRTSLGPQAPTGGSIGTLPWEFPPSPSGAPWNKSLGDAGVLSGRASRRGPALK